MAEESKTLTHAVLRTVGFAQAILVGFTIVFVAWVLLVDTWPDVLVPSTSLGVPLYSVNVWLGNGGWLVIGLVAASLLGEAWLGVIRFLVRRLNRFLIRHDRGKGQNVFSASALNSFKSLASESAAMRDLEELDRNACTRHILLWVVDHSGRSRILSGEAEMGYEELQGRAELRLGLIPWLPVSILLWVQYLNHPPANVVIAGVLLASAVMILLVVDGFRRWQVANSFLLEHLARNVDWSRYARLATGIASDS